MTTTPSPEFVELLLVLARYGLIAFAILMASLTLIAVVIIWRSGGSPETVALFVQNPETGRLATTILIIVAVVFLSVLGILPHEAVVAVLSAIAGFVLGDKKDMLPRLKRPPKKEDDPGI